MYKGLSELIPVGAGERIDKLCQEKDINYKELCEKTGISRYCMANVIEGYDCKLSSMIKLAKYFNCSLNWLILGKN